MKNLSFNSELHEYRITDADGVTEIAHSVTEIAAAVTGKDCSLVPADKLQEATRRGTDIHRDVELRKFETPEGIWIAQQIDIADYRSEVAGWSVIGDINVAGTCDLLSYPELSGEIDLCDIKSEAGNNLLYWTIQLNLYRLIFCGGQAGRLFVLHVPKTGNFYKVPIAILSKKKIAEIVQAFNQGKTLDYSFLSQTAKDAPEEALELIVYKQDLGGLTTNAKTILDSVRAKCATYKAENYNAENIADAKRDKAELNALAAKANAERLKREREFMAPFVEFKDTVGLIVDEIKKASSLIDGVVKDVEAREKDEKKKLIRDWFDELKTDLVELEQIFLPAWLNKGAKVKDVQAEITARLEKIKTDLAVLGQIGEPDAKAFYLSTLDMEAALKKADEIKAARERLAKIEAAKIEQRRIEAEEKEAAKARLEAARATAKPEPKQAAPEPIIETPIVLNFNREPQAPVVEILERVFRVRCTREQLIDLSGFLNDRGIEFEKVSLSLVYCVCFIYPFP